MADPPLDTPLSTAASAVGDRWSLLLVDALLSGPRTFGELEDRVAGISPNVLSARLKSLAADDLVLATPYSQRPLRYSYELTERGADLRPALRMLSSWAARHSAGAASAPGDRHEVCGSQLTARVWCPTCDVAVDDDATNDIEL